MSTSLALAVLPSPHHYSTGSGLAGCCLQILDRLRDVKIPVKKEDGGDEELNALRSTVLLRSEDGRTALHSAAAKGLTEVVEQLLSVGGKQLACVAAADGRTSLHWAAGTVPTSTRCNNERRLDALTALAPALAATRRACNLSPLIQNSSPTERNGRLTCSLTGLLTHQLPAMKRCA